MAMVNGIGGGPPSSNMRGVGGPGPNKPVDGLQEAESAQAAQITPAATPTPETEKALQGQMNAAAALGQSQLAKANGPAKSVQAMLAAIPPGSTKDKLLDSVAEKVATKTVPEFAGMDAMDKALTLSDIRVAILENKELSSMLGIKL
jgi:hypothetical protein